jgi:predicted alpha/beta superfamily hydrolase
MRKLGLLAVVFLQAVATTAVNGETQNAHSSLFITEIIASEILDENRPISIYLPRNYASSGASYPVLYLLDGEKHIFHVTGLVDFLVSVGRIPELIIVGIHGIDRYRDYTPNKIEHHAGTGGALKFTKFLMDELFGHIESTYRTRPFRMIFGHSYGGT